MFLRFLLIGVTATLGLDASRLDGHDLVRLSEQGRSWVQTRLAEWSSHRDWIEPTVCVADAANVAAAAETESTPTAVAAGVPQTDPAPALPAEPDAIFEGIVEGMTTRFAADLAPPTAPPEAIVDRLDVAPALPPAAEELAAEMLNPGLAFALNREADGLDEPASIGPDADAIGGEAPAWFEDADSVFVADAAAPASDPTEAPVPVEPAPVEVPAVPANRAGRLASAVTLTGQAISAWMSVLQTPTVAYATPGPDAVSR